MTRKPLLRSPASLLLWCVGSLFLMLPSIHAQETGAVVGTVRDETGNPLHGVIVRVPDSPHRTATDRNGAFNLPGLPVGPTRVLATYVGRQNETTPVAVRAGQVERITLTLQGSDDDVVEMESFLVSSYPSELAAALSQQKAAGNITHVVASDAIGNFPDVNAAEALQRLPGVSVENQRGEGRFLIIRGAAPNYNSITMDGASVLSSERDGRTVSLDIYPAEQLARIEVSKAITPDLPGDSIGGSVNLVTKRAFDHEGRKINANIYASYNSVAEDWGQRGGVSYSDTFGDSDNWGLQISASHSERVSEEHSHETPPVRYRSVDLDGNTYTIPDRLIQAAVGIERTRRSLSATLENRSGDGAYHYVRGTFNRLTEDNNRPLHQLNFNRNRFITPYTTQGGEIATVTNNRLDGRRQGNTRTFEDTYSSLAWGGEWIKPESKLTYQLSYSLAQNTQDSVRGEFNTVRLNDPFLLDFSDFRFPVLGQNAQDHINDPDNFVFSNVRVNDRDVDHGEWAAKVNYERQTQMGGIPFTWKVGGQARLADMDSSENTADYGSFDDGSGNDLLMSDPRFGTYMVAGDFMDGRYTYGPSPNDAAFTRFFRDNMGLFGAPSASPEVYDAQEDIYAAFLMGSWQWTKVTLLSGVRWERTDIEYDDAGIVGNRPPGAGDFDPSGSYDNLLPSLHLRYEMADELIIRFAWSNTIARPKFDRMAPFESIDVDGTTGDVMIDRGNPDLHAVESMNWDLMAEYYMPDGGVLSAGVFYKQLDGPIFRSAQTSLENGVNVTVDSFFNAGQARILGLELNYQKQFTFLPGALSGLGISANATFTGSDVDVPARAGEEFPLFQQSDNIGNASLFYEKHGFNARLAYNWRSRFLREIGNNPQLDIYEGDYRRLDLQVGYQLGEHWRVQFEANNLNNEPEYLETGYPRLPSYYALTGTTYSVGVQWNH